MRPADVATALALAFAPGLARAHETGISYGDFMVQGARVDASLRLSAAELAAMVTDRDTIGTTLGALLLTRGGAPCAFAPGEARSEPPDGTRVTGTFGCAQTGPLRVSAAGLLSRMPWGHTHLAKVTVGGRVEEHVLRSGRDAFDVEDPPSWPAQAARFLRLGLEHIFTGYDHIAFVLGLLLLGGTLRRLVAVVTSFTLAHSVTLAAAALDVVRLPPALVEPLIAASIVCIAAENLVELRRPSPRAAARRWRLGFAFGLVHGFGFAGALTELHLSTAGLATALLSFNVGVEFGQATIVAAAFPLVAMLRAWPVRAPLVLRTASFAIGAAGIFWLAQRLPWPRYVA
jgi:hydrogenase/urease accessory protein HupE